MCEKLSLMSGELAERIVTWQPAEIVAYQEDEDAEPIPWNPKF